MPVTINNEVYITQQEARDLLGGISDNALRKAVRKEGIQRYKRPFAPNIKYYKKSDIERMAQMQPVIENEDEDEEEGEEG